MTTPYDKEVLCARCGKPRWVLAVVPEPYTCQRCRAVLAGRPADDPLSKPVTAERRVQLQEQLRKGRAKRPQRAV